MSIRKQQKLIILVGLLTACLCLTAIAQKDDKSKITVEIVTDKDGEKQVFKKTYSSVEEMENDKEFQKLNAGEKSYNFNWNSNKSGDGETVTIMRGNRSPRPNIDSIIVEVTKDLDKSFTVVRSKDFEKAFEWSMDSLPSTFEFKGMPEDVIIKMGKLGGDSIITKVLAGKFRDMEQDIEIELGDDRDVRRRVVKSERTASRVMIADLDPTKDAAYIKSAKYDPAKAPAIDALTFNRERGAGGDRFRLSFKVAEEAPLKVKLTTTTGLPLYVEGLTTFMGTYERNINLADLEGKELFLDLTLGKKRTIKRIVLQ